MYSFLKKNYLEVYPQRYIVVKLKLFMENLLCGLVLISKDLSNQFESDIGFLSCILMLRQTPLFTIGLQVVPLTSSKQTKLRI